MTTLATAPDAADTPDSGPAGTDPRHRRLVRPMPTDDVAGWLGPLGVFLFALLLRLDRLGVPGKEAFDEVYYRKDAFDLLRFGFEKNNEGTGAGFIVHPPLGKWMIAIGEQIYGNNSFGWRISAAVFGAVSVLLLCRIARRLFRSTLLGCIAGVLLAMDGLHFVQSRMAMLDIFLLFWVLAAFGCVLVDRDVGRARLADRLDEDLSYPGPKLGFRWWRVGAAVCLGAAMATKWSALFFLVAFVLLALAWEVGARRTAGVPAPLRAAIWRELPSLLVLLVGLAGVVYVASWAGWFATDGGWRRTCGTAWQSQCGPVDGFIKYHQEILHFHSTLQSGHTYKSTPWGWLLLARPVSYFYETPQTGYSQEILGIGTPAIWWASLFALGYSAWSWVSRRDWRAAAILVSFVAGYLPWFYYSITDHRTMFLFYALPMVPFMCLALTYCAGSVLGRQEDAPTRRRWAGPAIGGYLLLVAWNFWYLHPVLAAKVLPYQEWRDRMWFGSWI